MNNIHLIKKNIPSNLSIPISPLLPIRNHLPYYSVGRKNGVNDIHAYRINVAVVNYEW